MKIDKILEAYKTDITERSGNKITVYVPKEKSYDAVNDCIEFFKEKFGNYYSQSGEVFNSDVQPSPQPYNTVAVFAYCNDEQLEQHIEELIAILKDMKASKIFFDINGEFFAV